MSKQRVGIIIWALVSLGIHFLYFIGLIYVPSDWLHPLITAADPAIEVSLIDKQDIDAKSANNQQFVRQTQTDESLLIESQEKARFMSQKKQRVLLETRARNIGLSENRSEEPRFLAQARREKQAKDAQDSRAIKLSQTGLDYSEFKPFDAKKQLQEFGSSTVGEALPLDVTVGSFTALNTDQFTYYTFYARIEEMVRFRWETKVKEAVDGFNRNFLTSKVIQKSWITEVEFLLTPTGEFYKARILRESGIPKFDSSSVWAFRDTRIFPNPPQELVREDGYIHLHYSFNVQLAPSSFAEK